MFGIRITSHLISRISIYSVYANTAGDAGLRYPTGDLTVVTKVRITLGLG